MGRKFNKAHRGDTIFFLRRCKTNAVTVRELMNSLGDKNERYRNAGRTKEGAGAFELPEGRLE